MKIAILGAGYVGLSTGVVLAEIGHFVHCIDLDHEKIKKLNNGISPIYEPGLEDLLFKNIHAGRLKFTISHLDGLKDKEIIIIAVGTPQRHDGAADLSYLEQAAKDISTHLSKDTIVAIKSTVPVGTNEKIKEIFNDQLKNKNINVQMISNPEFLRQGSAIMDTMQADRIIIGADNRDAAKKIREMYRPLNVPVLLTSIKSAEMIKYASNAFLATKISYINEIANLCEAVGADVEDVAKGMGKDLRIGEAFLRAGIGYGGSCFPKDVKALIHTAALHGLDFSLLKDTIEINDYQRELIVLKALKRFGELKGKKIAMLGLAFKPETDDMREAPSIPIAHSLVRQGAEVVAYDPVANENAKKVIGNVIRYEDSIQTAIKNADAVFIITEWNEIKQIKLTELTKFMKQPIVFDGRNCFEEDRVRECENIEYYPVGRPAIIKK
ncbi:UDP-glucose dehydrogenase family protein [Bacillus sp. Marseille-P3661]|uniref:UDP-glucose dehydrogenase family protein n=1 Tax=Bacillus sp. Marseille-P3661 TaxID=1936234 RepID=UPI000C865885|nr:UDP-glucose/GDP-mannose dehydrogenase family protein [Bacillus sp. Marseille-P3661]